ncbi:MAG TPA: molybdopterin oxidoreductase family protein [Candidatus Didemnitutus sp.]|nr:molybdopterin oxidoreductase family protein [Candidatus Didemnitutus sp.]
MIQPVENMLRARDGAMTSELVLRPGDFGLGQVPHRLKPAGTARSICGFCSTGCSLKIHLNANGEAINLTPDPAYPVNLGMACPKGWEALTPLAATDRATTPLLRNTAGALAPVSWDRALKTFTRRFKSIIEKHGPQSLGVLSTGQIVTEEMALLGALTKFGMGIPHLDSNTRQCMATTHVAYKESLGFDAPPFTYADFEESEVLVFVGANPCIAHPIMWQRVMRNPRSPKILVVDPRRTETAAAATHHFALQPKSDLVLLYGLAHLLIARGAVDRAYIAEHTQHFAEFAQQMADFPPARVATATGLTVDQLDQFVELISSSRRVSFWWTMGVNQGHESTRTAQAIINLALMTGNFGRPGTGANSITGQCNAMGSRLFGNATSLLGGYDFANFAHRAHVARTLGIEPALIPSQKSIAYDEILDGVNAGRIKGLWVIATNTAHSWISQGRFAELRRKLDFLVVQDMYASTETALLADLVLPAAGWGEKEGVFINSERRFGVARKVARAPGLALSDFAIFRLVAEHWGCGEMFARWQTPADAFAVMRELSRGQPFDFTGVRDYDHVESAGGIQWPWTEANEAAAAGELPPPERRLFADGEFFTPNGRARFVFDIPQEMPEQPDDAYPFLLLTGRGSSAQWHTGSRTDKSAVLRKLAPTGLWIEIAPDDAARLEIVHGQRVLVRSRRGVVDAVAAVTPTVRPGQVFLPMHFAGVNRLTFPAFDPHSRQPSYKACAVRVEKPKAR